MRILKERTGTAYTIHGECCMLSKYGEVFNCIDNAYHPNPGLEEEEYPEIELCIDWLIRNNLGNMKYITNWIGYRIINAIDEGETDINDIAENYVFYSDLSNISKESIDLVKELYEDISNDDELYAYYAEDVNEFETAKKIVRYINETFTRVRAGGKLNSRGSDEIYFRISSHGYDWSRVFTEFLWDVFKDIKDMPRRIWIGHDLETMGEEKVLFDGTPEELFDKYDNKIMEEVNAHKRSGESVNWDRESAKLNLLYNKLYKHKKFI